MCCQFSQQVFKQEDNLKRERKKYELELDPFACYKMEYIHDKAKANYESTDKWLYLGADAGNQTFAKVGITMGDLTSRSSSSANPRYHLFCAFKCDNDITMPVLEGIEKNVLSYLESIFLKPDGSTMREAHCESGRISECFYGVNFLELFCALHSYLYEKYGNYFVGSEFYEDDEFNFHAGNYLDCEFSPRISLMERNNYIRMILQPI